MKLDYVPRPWQQMRSDFAGATPAKLYKGRGRGRYAVLDMVAAFDIEVTSVRRDVPQVQPTDPAWKAEAGVIYVWQFALDGIVYMGRTWEEYVQFCDDLVRTFDLCDVCRLMVWVHNLAYEFQFMRKWFDFAKIFATKVREPVTALTTDGVEYHCSYKLTLASLQYVATDLIHQHKIRKLVGDLDYDRPRHPGTPLTDHEIAYCVNDVLILNAFIDERRREDGGLNMIPMTKTGYVRNECRLACMGTTGYDKWIKKLTLTPQEYLELSLVKAGGFTHSSVWHTGEVCECVTSRDIASSYPTVMCCEMFPMECFAPAPVRTEQGLNKYRDQSWYCRVELRGLEATQDSDFTLSASKCTLTGAQLSNGRVIRAESAVTWITDVDYEILKDFYRWDTCIIDHFSHARRGYLPRPLVGKILEYYAAKTSLKRVDDVAYMRAKERVNSVFGMMLTDPVTGDVRYVQTTDGADCWDKGVPVPPADKDDEDAMTRYHAEFATYIADKIDLHNRDKKRFTFFPWGVWVTAYARRNVTKAIKYCGSDYIYCDTDSVKAFNDSDHADFFTSYDADIDAKIARALAYHGFPADAAAPRDPKGEAHPMGHFEFDGSYKRFKTLGAKRYMYETGDGKIKTTVAGCGKGLGEYLAATGDPFCAFADGLVVPADVTGKLIHAYGDYDVTVDVTDYLGVTRACHEKSWVCLGPCEYRLGLDDEFAWWLQNTDQIGITKTPIN